MTAVTDESVISERPRTCKRCGCKLYDFKQARANLHMKQLLRECYLEMFDYTENAELLEKISQALSSSN